jgi:hypothetical protein
MSECLNLIIFFCKLFIHYEKICTSVVVVLLRSNAFNKASLLNIYEIIGSAETK